MNEIARARIEELEGEVLSLKSKIQFLRSHRSRIERDNAVIAGQLAISKIDRTYPVDF